MSVIRVGFVLGQVGWLGGVNYFRNLFSAIQSLPDAKIRPVVFAGLKSDVSAFEGLAEIIRIPILDRGTFPWLVSKLLGRVFPRRDYSLYWFLRKHQIDLISHFGQLWRGCSIPSVGWIPDFQHLHLPKFFEKKECSSRDAQFLEIISRCDAVLLSSQDALDDLNKFCPDNATPTHILRFVSGLDLTQNGQQSREELMVRYKLDRPWFHIPNQFWAHKNHNVVVEALRMLKAQGNSLLVLATGSTNDSRNPDYFPSFMKRVSDYGLQDDFRILGMVPYPDVVALMQYSVAVINPSLFEGWSTSVEESKSMGKKIILSDIAVHREQNPERGYYFDPNNPNELVSQMQNLVQQYDQEEENIFKNKSKIEQVEKILIFAKQFEMICFKVVNTTALGIL